MLTSRLPQLADLKFFENIIPTTKKSPAARARYLYYPDHLVRMPGPAGITESFRRLYSLFFEPIYAGIWKELGRELVAPSRDDALEDESVGHFLQRRFGKAVADNFASAVFHGIYAGDIYKLSARTLLPSAWFLETRDSSSSSISLEVMDMMLKGFRLHPEHVHSFRAMRAAMGNIDPSIGAMAPMIEDLSVYTFHKGLGSLASKLEESLSQNPNVVIHKESRVDSVNSSKSSDKLTVHIEQARESRQFDYVVSSLAPNSVRSFLEQSAQARGSSVGGNVVAACNHSHRSVNVMVVNLYYRNPDLIPTELRGFGYLIPRSVPAEQNPERALGVIFGSETSGIRGRSETRRITRSMYDQSLEQLEAEHEKMSQQYEMLKDKMEEISPAMKQAQENILKRHEDKIKDTKRDGEKWFGDDPSKEFVEFEIKMGQDSALGTKLTVMIGGHWWDSWAKSDLPDEQEAVTMATTLLRRHLNITDEPEVAKARLAENCIPQYPVGYRRDMARIHEGLLTEYQGRFKVAGPWWQGAVGVNDCIRNSQETAWSIREQSDDQTGLEGYTKDESWYIVQPRTGEVTKV